MRTKLTSPSRFGPIVVLVAALLAALMSAAPAWAHDSTDGSISVAIDDQRVIVTAPVAFAELGFSDTSGDGLVDAAELTDQEAMVAESIVATVRDHVRLSVDGEVLEIIGAGVPSLSETGSENGDVAASQFVMLVFASAPHDGEVTDVELDWAFGSPSTTVVLSHPDGVTTGELADTGMITFTLDPWSSATAFFDLGIEHIQLGPDHLLFLLVLTLAVAGTTVTIDSTWRIVKLVTAFTIGHAVSLGLAYFEVITIPAAIVEPAISLSIVGAAVLAIRGRSSDARPWIASIVGLVHGLGFASSLGSLGVVTSQQVAALAAFNLGIDIAQTVVVLLAISVLWLSGQALAERIVWVRTSVAASAALVGVVWTASRLTDLVV